MLRRLAPFVLALVLGTGLVGCAAETIESAAQTPAPRFATEAEAFAAAEETYRAYVDALNQVDLSDPDTFEAVYAWTTGDANASSRKTFSEMHADGWTVSGSTSIQVVELIGHHASAGTVELATCTDVSSVEVTDPAGASVVSKLRGDLQSMEVVLVPEAQSPTGFVLSSLVGRSGEPLCE